MLSSNLPANTPGIPVDQSEIYRFAWRFYLVLAICGVLWIGASQGSIPLTLFLETAGWWKDVALGIAGGFALVALWDAGRKFVLAMQELEKVLARYIGSIDSSEVFALALISGFSEELFFRGAIQTSWGWVWAMITFTVLHSGPGRIFRWWTLFAFVAALVFGGLTLIRGNILAAVIAHVVVNTINLRHLRVATLD